MSSRLYIFGIYLAMFTGIVYGENCTRPTDLNAHVIITPDQQFYQLYYSFMTSCEYGFTITGPSSPFYCSVGSPYFWNPSPSLAICYAQCDTSSWDDDVVGKDGGGNVKTMFDHGEDAYFSCVGQLLGLSSGTCFNGSFNGIQPSCDAWCPAPDDAGLNYTSSAPAESNGDYYVTGTDLTFFCDSIYPPLNCTSDGNNCIRSCQDGTWFPDPLPKCLVDTTTFRPTSDATTFLTMEYFTTDFTTTTQPTTQAPSTSVKGTTQEATSGSLSTTDTLSTGSTGTQQQTTDVATTTITDNLNTGSLATTTDVITVETSVDPSTTTGRSTETMTTSTEVAGTDASTNAGTTTSRYSTQRPETTGPFTSTTVPEPTEGGLSTSSPITEQQTTDVATTTITDNINTGSLVATTDVITVETSVDPSTTTGRSTETMTTSTEVAGTDASTTAGTTTSRYSTQRLETTGPFTSTTVPEPTEEGLSTSSPRTEPQQTTPASTSHPPEASTSHPPEDYITVWKVYVVVGVPILTVLVSSIVLLIVYGLLQRRRDEKQVDDTYSLTPMSTTVMDGHLMFRQFAPPLGSGLSEPTLQSPDSGLRSYRASSLFGSYNMDYDFGHGGQQGLEL